ncbi:cytochrome c oxidase cbb3-type subunit 4 [Pseudomonas flavescens]|uniref:Cytochrome c oxidase cbb3-type subunit 4 n=1 Tax=Phytopseudomonas flavescens TaxID=29435 RepID=A0A1G7XH48_9GAMM|nr:CcoQ/FixQ family Cbb3-type cytochrome c oxidase assembly chaperone [Pseudomonas flavescens]SDG83401.1 cytochrome c oxidase cbb3-type subunit 4 [Pseudomonas flavescens]
MPALLTDIGTIRGIGTAVVFIAFVAVVFWAYGGKRKSSFDEAANLPFADEPEARKDGNDSAGSDRS